MRITPPNRSPISFSSSMTSGTSWRSTKTTSPRGNRSTCTGRSRTGMPGIGASGACVPWDRSRQRTWPDASLFRRASRRCSISVDLTATTRRRARQRGLGRCPPLTAGAPLHGRAEPLFRRDEPLGDLAARDDAGLATGCRVGRRERDLPAHVARCRDGRRQKAAWPRGDRRDHGLMAG